MGNDLTERNLSITSDTPYRVLIIGLGRIGMGYDLDKSHTHVLSHARAFRAHEKFRLAGGVDDDGERRKVFEASYNCPAFPNIESAMRMLKPDIVAVAVPTDKHAAVVQQVLSAGSPRAILCEKPLASSLRDGIDMLESCRKKECALYVNYMRCSDVTVNEILKCLDTKTIQAPLKGIVWYSKGLYNSASHFVNLSQYLLGEVIDIHVSGKGDKRVDQDPEPDFRLTFTRGEIHFVAAGAGSLFHNSMEWITPNGRLRYERGGAVTYWEVAASDSVYSGYTVIGTHAEQLPADFQRIQWYVADQLAASLDGHHARICTGESALRTMEVITRIEESL